VWQREITVRGKAGKARIVKISYDAARVLDRYLRILVGRTRWEEVRSRDVQEWIV
jgi:site-specific recombinase XerD